MEKIRQAGIKKNILEFPYIYCSERAKRLGFSASGSRYAKKRIGVTYLISLMIVRIDSGIKKTRSTRSS
ncbi:MAG: hypothetical protein SFT68_03185 [Rickettsiaceae bacterium]|nr:hypothetical protein [Rickettsiaceae bacterium]